MAEILSDKRKQLLGLKKKMEEFMPANKIFNGEIIEIKEGYVKTLFPFNKKFIGNYKKNIWFGGVLSGIVDWVGATAASTILDDNDINLSTVEMKIKYLLPAVANNDLYAEAEILSFSQNLIRVSIYIRQNEQIITEAKSLFVVMPIE